MLNKEHIERWIEIQFWKLCHDIMKFKNNVMDVMDYIDSMIFLNSYNAEIIKQLAVQVLSDNRYKPTKEEIIILCYEHKYTTQYIKDLLNLHNKSLYIVINRHKQEPMFVWARFNSQEISEIKKFLDTVEKIRKVGFTLCRNPK